MWNVLVNNIDQGLNLIEDIFGQNCEFVVKKQKHEKSKKVREQYNNFSRSLSQAIKIRERFYSMMNTKYITIGEMIGKLQNSKGKTKLRFHQGFTIF